MLQSAVALKTSSPILTFPVPSPGEIKVTTTAVSPFLDFAGFASVIGGTVALDYHILLWKSLLQSHGLPRRL